MLSFLTDLIPAGLHDLMRLQVLSMIFFMLYAIIAANIRKDRRRETRIDTHFVLITAVAGANFPASICLLLSVWHPHLISLFTAYPLYLAIAGLVGIYLSLYALVK